MKNNINNLGNDDLPLGAKKEKQQSTSVDWKKQKATKKEKQQSTSVEREKRSAEQTPKEKREHFVS